MRRLLRVEQLLSYLVPVEHRVGRVSQALKCHLEIVNVLQQRTSQSAVVPQLPLADLPAHNATVARSATTWLKGNSRLVGAGEGYGGVDEAEVGVGLGVVAQEALCGRVVLLGEQAGGTAQVEVAVE